MNTLLDLAIELEGRPREMLQRRPVEVLDWRSMTCYKSDFRLTQVCGRGTKRWVDQRQAGTSFDGRAFPTLMDIELRAPYMKAAHAWGRPREADLEALAALRGSGMPSFCTGETPTVPMVLVDLSRFYLQFMQKTSTWMVYRRPSGIFAPVGRPWHDIAELGKPIHKVIYAAIPTYAWRSPTFTLWDHGNAVEQPSRFFQPQGWALLCDTAHSIARDAVEGWHCPRLSTDGYWVPETAQEAFQDHLEGDWGFVSKVKERWEPGQPWPWQVRRRLRPIERVLRVKLAQQFTGNAPVVRLPPRSFR